MNSSRHFPSFARRGRGEEWRQDRDADLHPGRDRAPVVFQDSEGNTAGAMQYDSNAE
jgi:hypothetical protein